jgi:predicted restriction endonuclease
MNDENGEVLGEFIRQIESMKVHRSAREGAAKKKPLLLLLLISWIERGRLSDNKILFSDVEPSLSDLIIRFGGRSARSGPRPEQPFFHLSTAPFWNVRVEGNIDKDFKRTPSLRSMRHSDTYGHFANEVFEILRHSSDARKQVGAVLLSRWEDENQRCCLREALSKSNEAA